MLRQNKESGLNCLLQFIEIEIFRSPLDVGFAPFQLVSGDGMGRDAERESIHLITITSRNNNTIRNNKEQ